MGKIGKIVGSVVALTSEAIHAYKASKVKRREENGEKSTFSIVLDSHVPHNDGCAFADNSEIDPLINSKNSDSAVSFKNEHGRLCRDNMVHLGQGCDCRGPCGCDCAVDNEEEDSDLDDGSERTRAPSYTEWPSAIESIAKPKVKKNEGRVQRLIRMAGPVPKALLKESCTVIIPQRRPGNKYRGFVRAYAPVLEDFGITRDVFFRFLKDFDNVNRVCSSIGLY
ncbi:hypothetical protein N7488_008844 [Penicillium malachiteum]|nr:hypothetical protein N7488_008844 [Penicillium malachiteum]